MRASMSRLLPAPPIRVCCPRAIADEVAGLFGSLPQHLRAEVLLRILELHLLGDGHSIVADDRGAPLLLDQHRFGLRSERDAHSVGKLRGATQHFLACIRAEQDLLGAHGYLCRTMIGKLIGASLTASVMCSLYAVLLSRCCRGRARDYAQAPMVWAQALMVRTGTASYKSVHDACSAGISC